LAEAAIPKSLARTAWAKIIPAKFLFKQFVAVYNPHAAFHLLFRWESTTSFAHRLEKMAVHQNLPVACYTS